MLVFAGWLSVAIAALHLVMIFVGAPAYDYFGAGPKMVELARAGSLWPSMITLGLTAVFATFGLYAFAGAGYKPRLPFPRVVLVAIAMIYTLRGILVVPQLLGLIETPARGIEFHSCRWRLGWCMVSGY